MIQKCVICNKEFEAQKSTAKYCSNDCRNAARRAKYTSSEKGMKEKICPICENAFIPKTPAASQRICCYDCMPDGI